MHLVTSCVNGRVLHMAYPFKCGQPPESSVYLARQQMYEGFPEHTSKKQRSVGHLAIRWRNPKVCVRTYCGWISLLIATCTVAWHLQSGCASTPSSGVLPLRKAWPWLVRSQHIDALPKDS